MLATSNGYSGCSVHNALLQKLYPLLKPEQVPTVLYFAFKSLLLCLQYWSFSCGIHIDLFIGEHLPLLI